MKDLRSATKFRRDLKRMTKRRSDIDILNEVIDLLRQGESLDERWRDHSLKGEWVGSRECHLSPDWLLIYEVSDDEIFLQRTGSHADLFE